MLIQIVMLKVDVIKNVFWLQTTSESRPCGLSQIYAETLSCDNDEHNSGYVSVTNDG
jgi:hypothetical protein